MDNEMMNTLHEHRKWVESEGKEGTRASFTGADFSGRDFSNIDFSLVILDNVDFTNANLQGVNFEAARMEDSVFIGARCDKANFCLGEVARSDFTGASLRYADFRMAQLNDVDFTDADLSYADLWLAELERANFIDADYADAMNLDDAYCSETIFDPMVQSSGIQIYHKGAANLARIMKNRLDNNTKMYEAFYYIDSDGRYICCDNTDKKMVVEVAYNIEDAVSWLKCDILTDELYERNKQYLGVKENGLESGDYSWKDKSFSEYIKDRLAGAVSRLEGEEVYGSLIPHHIVLNDMIESLTSQGHGAREFIKEYFYEAVDMKERATESVMYFDAELDPLLDSQEFALNMVVQGEYDLLNQIELPKEIIKTDNKITIDKGLIQHIKTQLGRGDQEPFLRKEKDMDFDME